jgi:hypothetical protein
MQHGAPMQVLDMGETSIDEETFIEYLEEMRSHYTADKVCVSFLVLQLTLTVTVPPLRYVSSFLNLLQRRNELQNLIAIHLQMIASGFLPEAPYPPTSRVTNHPHLGLPGNIEPSLIDPPTSYPLHSARVFAQQ